MLYPSATPSRFVENLSGIWNFKLDDGTGLDAGWQNRPLEDATTMPVPASYNDLKEGVDFRDHYAGCSISAPSRFPPLFATSA